MMTDLLVGDLPLYAEINRLRAQLAIVVERCAKVCDDEARYWKGMHATANPHAADSVLKRYETCGLVMDKIASDIRALDRTAVSKQERQINAQSARHLATLGHKLAAERKARETAEQRLTAVEAQRDAYMELLVEHDITTRYIDEVLAAKEKQ